MTLQDYHPKSNGKVSFPTANVYSLWRQQGLAVVRLRDGDSPPPEQLVQAIWCHQRLRRDALRLTDGRRLRILHPGFWNHAAGPDFRNAVIQIESEPPRSGDIEVDLVAQGWRAHGHEQNPAYAQVVLHVVWDTPKEPAAMPTLVLRDVLDAPLAELALWLGSDGARDLPQELMGRCRAPLRDLSEDARADLLRQAAMVRLQSKAAQLDARAREAGWEQALWEGLLRALGYKNNVWPLQRIGEVMRFPNSQPKAVPVMAWQSRLLGVSGLLPTDLTRQLVVTDEYLRRVWEHWWRERDAFTEFALPRAVWRLSGLRPANHPQRRLALAAHWLAGSDLPTRLEQWFTTAQPREKLADSLLATLQPPLDDYWSWHWTLNSARMPRPQPLLGVTRVTDIAVNIVLPWLWIRAAAGKNEALRRAAEERYFAWPAGEDNAVLRLARQRLLGGAPRRSLDSAAAQQGLLQIVRDFCDHSNALCENCRFPELVRALGK
ncbi:MAG: DUF2851 family protein [Verrucomicrobiota bacterium]